MQKEEKNKSRQNEVRGLVKVAVLKEEEGLPDLIACSLCNTKSVHFLLTCVEEVFWMINQGKFGIKIAIVIKLLIFYI